MDDLAIRFSSLVRRGLRFRKQFESTKNLIRDKTYPWYPYDCFANLFYLERLLRSAGLSLEQITNREPVVDIGAADGALSFFFETMGLEVTAVDYSRTNMNQMQAISALARELKSSGVLIEDVDIDGGLKMNRRYGLALFLGTLYHLKNPFTAIETLSQHARFCLLSTRIAKWSPDRQTRLDNAPLAYLLAADECNGDSTNYWVFSMPGLLRLVDRAGWTVCASAFSGSTESDPSSQTADQRAFLLLRSRAFGV